MIKVSTTLRVAAFAAAVVVLCGCKPTSPIIEKPIPPGMKDEIISLLNSRADSVRTLKAKLDVSVRTAEMTSAENCGGVLIAQGPDKIRIYGRHDMLDYRPFDIGSDGKTWFVHTHIEENNQIHLGPTDALEEWFDPGIRVRPADIVLALGIGRLEEDLPKKELLFTRHQGFYLITEVVTNRSGRYVAKRITIEPDWCVITRLETFRPDGRIDMVAEMKFDENGGASSGVPKSARIRLLRDDGFLLDMSLHDRETGVKVNAKRVFALPRDMAEIPPQNVYRHEAPPEE